MAVQLPMQYSRLQWHIHSWQYMYVLRMPYVRYIQIQEVQLIMVVKYPCACAAHPFLVELLCAVKGSKLKLN
jgi:hypothetical protein